MQIYIAKVCSNLIELLKKTKKLSILKPGTIMFISFVYTYADKLVQNTAQAEV